MSSAYPLLWLNNNAGACVLVSTHGLAGLMINDATEFRQLSDDELSHVTHLSLSKAEEEDMRKISQCVYLQTLTLKGE